MSKYSNLVEEIDKQEEVKEQKANLDNELQLLKQAISTLHDSIQKVEKARKDGTDMVIAMKLPQIAWIWLFSHSVVPLPGPRLQS